MPVLEAVQTFAGITNENEFYSHHYLAEVFKGDIKDRLEAWDAQEAQHPSDAPDHEQHRAPPKRLQAWAQRWFALRGQVQRGKDEHERWQAFMQIQAGLLQALGYAPPPRTLTLHELAPGLPLPVWHLQGQRLAIIPAYQPSREDDDLLDHQLTAFHYGTEPLPPHIKGETWADLLSDAVFGADQPPRYVLLLGLDEWLLLDRYKWPNNRALRFNWPDILDRKDADIEDGRRRPNQHEFGQDGRLAFLPVLPSHAKPDGRGRHPCSVPFVRRCDVVGCGTTPYAAALQASYCQQQRHGCAHRRQCR